MKTEIASLQERISQGGNWIEFRNEISALHAEASTDEEYVALLEAYEKLIAVGRYAYDEETWDNLLPIISSEYRFFLIKEATEDGVVNPLILEKVTLREVLAERLDANDEFRALAVAGAYTLANP